MARCAWTASPNPVAATAARATTNALLRMSLVCHRVAAGARAKRGDAPALRHEPPSPAGPRYGFTLHCSSSMAPVPRFSHDTVASWPLFQNSTF